MKRNLLVCAAILSAFACMSTGCSNKIDQTAEVSSATEAKADEGNSDASPEKEEATEEATEPPLLDRAKKLLAQNPDTVGYISVPGTDVDNPVVQTVDNDYYLHIGFDGQDYRAGTVFMDFRDVFGWKEEENSENIILYGHNMADNTMFGSLRRYRQDMEFYKESPIVKFSSNYKDYSYVIFGLVITSGDAVPPEDDLYADPMAWEGFPYWNMEELDDKKHFNYYVDTIKKMNLVENKVDVEYGDELLTLSTCYSDEDNSRFIIVARKLREDETEASIKKLINSDSEEKTADSDSDNAGDDE